MLFRIVVALAFFTFSSKAAEEGVKNFVEISKDCEERNDLKNGEILLIDPSKLIETENVNVKCYFRCLLNELKLMDGEGNIILDGLANIKRDYWKHIVACINTTGIDDCDKALNFENCIWTKKKEDESK